MKRAGKYILSFLAGGLLCLAAFLYISSTDSEVAQQERPVVSAMSVSPEVPNKVMFCGEEIDMSRYNMREGFDREITGFSYLHSTTILLIKRANRYFPVIEPILEKNGIPNDFKYLAVIESNLDPRVTSPARAVGMWQFLESTGKQYGLTITPTVDERCHVEKATEAACKYLKEAYEKYKDWPTVAASYNAGMGRITGEQAQQYVDSSFDMWLVEETTRYVYRILAIKQIFENPYKYGFVLRAYNLYKPIECDSVTVTANIQDLAKFAQEKGITYADLKRFNPWLRDRKLLTLGKTYTLQIPKNREMYYMTPNTYVHNPAWVVR